MKCPIPYSKEELVTIRRAPPARKQEVVDGVIKALCQCPVFINTVRKYVLAHHGSVEDAEDLVQESLAQLAISLLEGRYKGMSSIENYAFGICKFKWLNRLNKKGIKVVEAEVVPEAKLVDREYLLIREESRALLWKIIQNVPGRCPEYLKLWAWGYKPAEIAAKMDVSERRARKNTYMCRNKLRNSIVLDERLRKLVQSLRIDL